MADLQATRATVPKAHAVITRDVRQLICELALMSHVPGRAFTRIPTRGRGSKQEGRDPTGGVDPCDDRTTGYQQKSAEYFARKLGRLEHSATVAQLEALRDEAKKALKDWKQTPLADGNLPVWGTLECEQFIVKNHRGLTQRELAKLWGVSHVAVGDIQRRYRGGSAE